VIDLYFYDRDGNPIPGKKPTPLHIIGGGKPDPVQMAGIRAAFLQFTTAARLSLAGVSSRTYVIDERCTLLVQQNQDTFRAFATVLPEDESEVFYGGIALRLNRVTDEAWWDNTGGNYPAPSILAPLSVANATGASVSGPLGDIAGNAPTDALIFQIAQRGDLSNSPVRRELVKIFRIRNPLIGNVYSLNLFEHGKYMLTARAVFASAIVSDMNQSSRLDVGAFYLCGQQINVPPLSVAAGSTPNELPEGDLRRDIDLIVRMYSIGFKITSFGKANETAGVIFVAVRGLLYTTVPNTAPLYRTALLAFDMARPGLGWQTLADRPAQSAIDFYWGSNVTDNNRFGERLIKLYGEHHFGRQSGFDVRTSVDVDGIRQYQVNIDSAPFPPAATGQPPPELLNANTRLSYSRSATWDISRWTDGSTVVFTQLNVNVNESGSNIAAVDAWQDYFLGIDWQVRQALCNYSASGANATVSQITWDSPRLGPVTFTRNNDPLGEPFASLSPSIGTVQMTPSDGDERRFVASDFERRIELRTRHFQQGTWQQPDMDFHAVQTMGPLLHYVFALRPDGQVIRRAEDGSEYRFDTVQKFPLGDYAGGGTMTNSSALTASYGGPMNAGGTFGIVPGNSQPSWQSWFAYAYPYPWAGTPVGDGYVVGDPDFGLEYVGTHSASVTDPPAAYTGSQYAALGSIIPPGFAGSPFASAPGGVDLTSSTPFNVESFAIPGNVFAPYYNECAYATPDTEDLDSQIWRDPRSGGYIFQIFRSGEAGINIAAAADLMIGNDDGCVPLVDVLNEWIDANGGAAGVYEDGRVITDHNYTLMVNLV
jgi:hypothetical protein